MSTRFDLLIVDGEVIDGTGRPRFRADVGIRDGRIAEIGDLRAFAADDVVSAAGRVVAPGFIDVHTHYDAQVLWDPFLTPSCFHGVTTVIGGNCGFTLAPMRPDAIDYLTSMLARVEGMPLDSLRAGVTVTWSRFGEYLARLDGSVALNVGFLVGHSTVRRIVMGPDWKRTATDEELAAMEALVEESLADGALGFSSSLSETHNDAAGDPTPPRFGTDEEMIRLAAAVGRFPGTWLEFIPWAAGPFPKARVELMAAMSAAAGRPLNWNLLLIRPDITESVVEGRLAAHDVAQRSGGAVYGLALPTPQTLRINLDSGFLFDSLPEWAEVLNLPRPEKLAALGDAAVRATLARAAQDNPRIWYDLDRLTVDCVRSASLQHLVGMTVSEVARVRQVTPFDALFDIAIEDDVATVFIVPRIGDDPESWKRRVAVWRDRRSIVGGSDAGAHLDMLDTFSCYSSLIGPVVRDLDLLSLEEAIGYITGEAATAFGITGRGSIAQGNAADLVIFDPATVGPGTTELRHDLPAGGARLFSTPTGVDRVIVNGVTIVEHGALTGATPGTVLRSGRDTYTVSVS